MSSPGRWDTVALRDGAAVALVFAVPFSIAARWIADSRGTDEDGSGLATLLSICALLGFVLGAGVAAWRQDRGTPLSHGVVSAVGTYVVAQAVFITVRLLMGEDVHWMAAVFNLTATSVAGLLGGWLGQSLLRKGIRPS